MLTPARVLAVVTSVAALVMTSAVAASADAPTTWETHEGYSDWEYLGVLFGLPIALFAVIWVFGALTARKNYVPPAPSAEVERHAGH